GQVLLGRGEILDRSDRLTALQGDDSIDQRETHRASPRGAGASVREPVRLDGDKKLARNLSDRWGRAKRGEYNGCPGATQAIQRAGSGPNASAVFSRLPLRINPTNR